MQLSSFSCKGGVDANNAAARPKTGVALMLMQRFRLRLKLKLRWRLEAEDEAYYVMM
ncbi:GH21582 [Drosophila grimshawi]|uniref:GH21582 n=1 Tax=Drosophila grimshawi TaxID=7222 RepID=B4JRW9_DROGR|nr:GH21582 [Drosophila grimshawi]